MRTRITEQYGIDLPIVGAGMGFIAMPPLAAAVSEAGGMGTLGGLGGPHVPPEALRALVRATRALTARPFGVNFITPFASDDHIRACIEERVAVVSFHMGEPPERQIAMLHEGGVRAWMLAGSASMARAAVRAGVDAVVAQGTEAGGSNRSVAAVLSLVPAVVDAVAPVPVLAAGGIADGRGVAAALALGADAVWVGTRLVATHEANAHAEYKRRIVEASEGATRVTSVFMGPERLRRPVRALENRVVRTWSGREEQLPAAAVTADTIGHTEWGGHRLPLHRFSTLLPTPETSGDFEEMCLPAGESAGLVRDVRPAGEVVRGMAREAESIIRGRLAGLAAPRNGSRMENGRIDATR